MSRRFGRRQRRRMREEIAALTAEVGGLKGALALDRGLLAHQGRKLDEQRTILQRVERILGRNWIGLAPKELVADLPADVSVQLLLPPPREEISWVPGNHIPRALPFRVEHLEQLSSSSDLDELQRCAHVRIRTPAGEVRYATTQKALMTLTREDFIHLLSREVVLHLASKHFPEPTIMRKSNV